MKVFCCMVINFGRFFWIVEVAKEVFKSIAFDLCLVLGIILVKGYSLKTRRVVLWHSSILSVLFMSNKTKVSLPIIESVSVDMVHFHTRRRVNYLSRKV